MILPLALIVAGLAAAVGLNDVLDAGRPRLDAEYTDRDLSMNGSRLTGFLFGAEGLVADWYFMRSLLYIGDKILGQPEGQGINIDDLRGLNPRLLYPLLDNATDLDPHFIAAYAYGAMLLPAIDPAQAIDLLNRGISRNPDSWRLYQHLGYIYWKTGDFEKASEQYEKGSEIAGAEPFMKLMAASMKTEGGSRSTARSIYTEMLSGSDDEAIRITAQRKLEQLSWFDQRDAINSVLAEFMAVNGRCANSFSEIAPSLMAAKLPDGVAFTIDRSNRLVDPTEAPYQLDKEQCKVKLDRSLTGLPFE